jgi:alkylation response protein AidB-like acyl-CoA dehydrogenase
MASTADDLHADLAQMVRSFLDRNWSATQLVAYSHEPGADQGALYARLATELDLVGVAVPEEFGGAGCGLVELSVVLRELGRRLYVGPYLATAVLATSALLASGDHDVCREVLPRLGSGELTATVAGLHELMESTAGPLPTAALADGTWRLTGDLIHVLDGSTADLLVVLANDLEGVAAFLVEPNANGLTRTPHIGVDLTRQLAELGLREVVGRRLGGPEVGAAVADRMRIVAAVAVAAEAVGAAEECLDLAVQHAKVRLQFGRPIGSFQAVKHRCADTMLDVEAARATLMFAAVAAEADEPDRRAAGADSPTGTASVAKAACTDALFRAAGSAVQVLGGIGYTWEHPAHLYVRRAMSSRFLFGSTATHRERLLGLHIAARSAS